MATKDHTQWNIFPEAVANSYSMIFFSMDRWFAVLLILLTFIDPVVGGTGFLAVIMINALAIFLGLDKGIIKRGEFGFNALLVGLGLGAFYEPNLPLLLLLFFAVIMTLFITILLLGVLTKYGLPFLSLPFVFGLWTVMLASRNFEALGISQRGLYFLNELYAVGENHFVVIYQFLNDLHIPIAIKTYFRSLGAILFQFNVLSGVVLALALLVYSRIAFILSLLGFFTAYGFYQWIGADLTQLNYNYIGFNFILSAIALGGFYLVPSRWSFGWVIILTPVLAILTSSLTNLLVTFQLGTYSLPFNLVVISFLYVLKWRSSKTKPEEVSAQTFYPEKNKYHYLSDLERYKNYRMVPIGMPFMGEWYVSQGPDGEYTHREDWRHAWDFVIVDENDLQYQNQGKDVEDYYCYGKPVTAPADGKVIAIQDGIEDNRVGAMNLTQNWGNSILIEHGLSLYSQISHIKPDSFKVKKGDTVKKGQELALCGNSGRSPYPHIHFQLQTTPYIGSLTYEYPISLYLSRENNHDKSFHFFDFPEEGMRLKNLEAAELMKYTYYFMPGKKITFMVDGKKRVNWECKADPYNQTYIECEESGAKAYFQNNGALHYFTSYIGKKDTLLYHFFLANYKVALSFQKDLKLKDSIPIDLLKKTGFNWLQDLMAPFYQYKKAGYVLEYTKSKGMIQLEEVHLSSKVNLQKWKKKQVKYQYTQIIKDYQVKYFEIQDGKRTIKAEQVIENI